VRSSCQGAAYSGLDGSQQAFRRTPGGDRPGVCDTLVVVHAALEILEMELSRI
jgi:hypothetical protein